jgi:hypothetical protein
VPHSSWLFIRDSESIWIERPRSPSLIIAGPGPQREQRDFIDDATLDAFQIDLAERLASQGWFLWAHDSDRRTGAERRTMKRETRERRHAVARTG